MFAVNPWLVSFPGALAAAGGVIAYGAAHPRSELFGPTIRHTPSPHQLAVTFDDGPNPAITPQLLDLLGRHNARATFFVIGRFVRQCPELVREIAVRGHALGNHTDTHVNLFWLGRARIREELRRCQEAIAEVTGTAPQWMRPPFGFRGPALQGAVREAGLGGVVMWSLMPGDWKTKPVERLIRRLAPTGGHAGGNRAAAGAGGHILCLHDGGYRSLNADRHVTLAALEYWLPRWRDLGLEFVRIETCAARAAR
jgi:peptidoglycan/xylan/chitin deacetylase (PgdA/CDA1 family)